MKTVQHIYKVAEGSTQERQAWRLVLQTAYGPEAHDLFSNASQSDEDQAADIRAQIRNLCK